MANITTAISNRDHCCNIKLVVECFRLIIDSECLNFSVSITESTSYVIILKDRIIVRIVLESFPNFSQD